MGATMVVIKPPCKYFKALSANDQKAGLCCLHPPNEVTNPKTGHRLTKVESPCWCGDYKANDQEG